jgi:hypothetical protein
VARNQHQEFECYAKALGDCAGSTSDEHIVSEAVLRFLKANVRGNPQVYAQNTAGLPRGVRRLRDIGRMTAPILCATHNSGLDLYDDAALAMCKASLALYDADNSHDPAAESFIIDCDRLERWMLKVLFGTVYYGRDWPPLAGLGRQAPLVEWLEILYERRKMPAGRGLYWLPTQLEGEHFETRDEVELLPWFRKGDGKLVGLRVWFFSFHFGLLTDDADVEGYGGRYRPAAIRVSGCNKRIEFRWMDGAGYPEIDLGK